MAKPGRLSYSNWFITINTNQRYATYEEAKPLLLSLQKAIKKVFEGLQRYVQFKGADGHDWSPAYILGVKVKQGVEFSPERGLPHVHFLIAIKHRSKIHLDYALIQKDVRESLAEDCPASFCTRKTIDTPEGPKTVTEPKNLYFFSRLYRDAAANYSAYVDKDSAARHEQLA